MFGNCNKFRNIITKFKHSPLPILKKNVQKKTHIYIF